jgi:hypothetical protein
LRENYNGGVAAITLAIIWAAKTPVETITKKERVSAETIAELIMDEVTMTMHAAAWLPATTSHSGRAYAHHCNSN